MKVLCLLLLFGLSLRLQAAEEGGEGGEGEGEGKLTVPPCKISHETLYSVFPELLEEGLVLYVNCLSFNEIGQLEHGVISGVNDTGGSGGERVFLSCVQGVIAAKPSPLPPLAVKMNSTACLECTDSPVEEEVCVSPCIPRCERCYEDATNCTKCVACVDPVLEHCYVSEEDPEPLLPTSCSDTCEVTSEGGDSTGPTETTQRVPRSDRFNFCDCPKNYVRELTRYPVAEEPDIEDIPEKCEGFFPELDEFNCVAACTQDRIVNEELDICFACGLEYCVRCNRSNGTAECLQCLEGTVLYDHECFACPKALIVLNALVQEEELEAELRDQELRQIELAVSLPALTVLVLLFFVVMSTFAHWRYPHVNPQGHKRHRIKPEDEPIEDDPMRDNIETPLSPTDVWRARPTIRLR